MPDSCPAEHPVRPVEGRLATRTRQRWARVQDLLAAGRSISAVARELLLQRKTVRGFARPRPWRSCWTGRARRAIACSTPTSRTWPSGSSPVASKAVQLTREITDIKALKRQMYGRAGFSPLRKRILNPA